MKLWGGPSDQGCCSVADVDDARRVCHQLGIDHHVFNFTDDFDAARRRAVPRRARARPHAEPLHRVQPPPEVRPLPRARPTQLGFDAVATGHHARVTRGANGVCELRRGADAAKDQSYVLHMLDQDALARTLLPVGAMTKADVRARADALGLRTAAKPDSQDTCFLPQTGGRDDVPRRPHPVAPGPRRRHRGQRGRRGRRRRTGHRRPAARARCRRDGGRTARRATPSTSTPRHGVVTVGTLDDLDARRQPVDAMDVGRTPGGSGARVLVQTSAHGDAQPATFTGRRRARGTQPQRRVAPGQSVVLYDRGQRPRARRRHRRVTRRSSRRSCRVARPRRVRRCIAIALVFFIGVAHRVRAGEDAEAE